MNSFNPSSHRSTKPPADSTKPPTTTKIVVVEVSATFPRIGRIACGLLMGHIVAHAMHGILEGEGDAGDQTPGEGDC